MLAGLALGFAARRRRGAGHHRKIGVTQPLTGALRRVRQLRGTGREDRRRGDQQAAGGVLGRKLQLIIEDNKSNPTEAVATAEKLINKR